VYSHDKPALTTDASVRAINAALNDAKWKPNDVDAFSANGSASVSYDRLEARSLEAVFGSHIKKLQVQSIKGMTGQSGSGCTVVQIAAACLCLFHKKLYGTVNFEEQDPSMPVLNIVKRT
jgi:act minimal PKS ketosynthase (KS/KS alpha)